MIREKNAVFELTTQNTTYVFCIHPNGIMEHLYYGERISLPDDALTDNCVNAMAYKWAFAPGNTISYDKEQEALSAECVMLEVSARGKGDIREPFLEVVGADGSRTLQLAYVDYDICVGKEEFVTLPGSYDEKNEVMQLKITLKDEKQGLTLELYYWVYEACDVITRSAVLYNHGNETVRVERLMSLLLDLEGDDYCVQTFTGAWAREMHRTRICVQSGRHVISSAAGTSSSRANPCMLVERPETGEEYGECLGFNLIYSGNHYEAVEVGAYGMTRVVSGISPEGFSWELPPGERLEAPEAVMTWSDRGRAAVSCNFHTFVREHIVRGTWKKKERPILLNSWEAFYFDFNESKILKLAERAKQAGVELFVLDDGWFGKRNDDKSSLGDWQENRKKLPDGLKGLAEKIGALGLSFGIWVEPEMVNTDSNLYRKHPEWVLEIPGRPHSEGRNQRMLDLGNVQVQEYIIEEMSRIFSGADISYVKWDMNRIVSDAYSQALATERQGEVLHRYQLGLYRCMRELTKRFPDILFEGCASGGNRFDLGILCYFPQIWASDNTDAMCRAEIQTGYSYCYPQSVISAHVSSCPNHQTLRVTPMETRFAVAAFGILGYECNLADMKKEELEAVREQIRLYKEWRSVFQFGQFYRGRGFGANGAAVSNLRDTDGNIQEWFCVSGDGRKEAALLLQRFAVPNNHSCRIRAKALDPLKKYHFYNLDRKYNVKGFGDLVNTVAPIHIRQDSLLHNMVAKLVKMDGEKEDYILTGDMLMKAGVNLKQPFGGTGYNEQVRYFPDYASRLYFMEEVK